jgi:hypothetical protein
VTLAYKSNAGHVRLSMSESKMRQCPNSDKADNRCRHPVINVQVEPRGTLLVLFLDKPQEQVSFQALHGLFLVVSSVGCWCS